MNMKLWASTGFRVLLLMLVVVASAWADPPPNLLKTCDSVSADQIARVLFKKDIGASILDAFYITGVAPWGIQEPTKYFPSKYGTVPAWFATGMIGNPFSKDSVLIVNFQTVGLDCIIQQHGAAAIQCDIGNYLAALRVTATDTTCLTVVELVKSIFEDAGINRQGGITHIERSELVPLGYRKDIVLSIDLMISGVGASSSSDVSRVGFWKVDWNRLIFLGSLPSGSYQRNGLTDIRNARHEYRLLDIDDNKTDELLLQRHVAFGKSWSSDVTDPAEIILSATDIAKSWEDQRLHVIGLRNADGTVSPIRDHLPMLVFPAWDGAAWPPVTAFDSMEVESRNQAIEFEQRSGIRYPQRFRSNLPYAQMGRYGSNDGEATLRAHVEHQELVLTIELLDTSYAPHPGSPDSTARYCVALLFDTELAKDFNDRECSDDELLVVVKRDNATRLATATSYGIRGKGEEYSFAQIAARSAGFRGRQRTYTFECRLPLAEVGPHRSDSTPRVCGFAAEILRSSEFPLDPWAKAVAISRPVFDTERYDRAGIPTGLSYHRFQPNTWGNLMIGVRKDTVYTK